MAEREPLPGEYGYEEPDEYYEDREDNPTCELCNTYSDEHGYCTEPGCRNEGKTVQTGRWDNFTSGATNTR